MQMVRRGFANLLSFSGRDLRSEFWPYAGVVVAGSFIASWFAMIPVMGAISNGFPPAESHEPVAVYVDASSPQATAQTEVGAALFPNLGPMLAVTAALALLIVGLLAAAVVRRLHDRGMRGLWGALPLPFLVLGLMGFPALLTSFERGDEVLLLLISALVLNNFAYTGCLVLLIIFLSRKGQPSANRYGPPTL
jgi:uncharacterized membrane protein YhaH (DUF805 family)